MESFINLLVKLVNGTGMTLFLFFLTLLFALPLGMLLALGRMSKHAALRKPVEWIILIVRGTPLMLQIFVVYFAPSYFLMWLASVTGVQALGEVRFNRYTMAVIAFVINYSCYFAEIYRGGIASIPKGQYEAGKVLGFTKTQVFLRLILPQVVKRILPPMSNEVINLIKDSALVQVIGIVDLFRAAQTSSSNMASAMPLLVAGVFYLVMNGIISKLFKLFEKKLSYYN